MRVDRLAKICSVVVALAVPFFGYTSLVVADTPYGSWTGPLVCPGQHRGTLTLTFGGDAAPERGQIRLDGPGGVALDAELRLRQRNRQIMMIVETWRARPDGPAPGRMTADLAPDGASLRLTAELCPRDPNASFALVRQGDQPNRPSSSGSSADGSSDQAPVYSTGWQGRWEGVGACRTGDERFPVSLDVQQDGNGLAGLLRLDPSWATVYDLYGLFTARVTSADQAVFESQIGAGNTGWTPRATRLALAGDQLTLDLEDIMEGRGHSGCDRAVLTHVGPSAAPDGVANITGAWHGYGFGNPQGQPIPLAFARARDIASHAAFSVEIVHDPEPRVLLNVTGGMGQPLNHRSHLVMAMRPFALSDQGPTIFVTTNIEVGTGRYNPANGSDVSAFVRSPLLAVFEKADDGSLLARLGLHARFESNEQWFYRLEPTDEDILAAIASGERPPYAMPKSFGGSLGAANSGNAQCAALDTWISQTIGAGAAAAMQRADRRYEPYLPLFADEPMEETFGLPLGFLAPEEAEAVRTLLPVCARIADLAAVLQHASALDGLFRTQLDEIASAISIRGDALAWADETFAALEAFDAGAEGAQAEIASLRTAFDERLADMTRTQREQLDRALTVAEAKLAFLAIGQELDELEAAPAGDLSLSALAHLRGRIARHADAIDAGWAQHIARIDGLNRRAEIALVDQVPQASLGDDPLDYLQNSQSEIRALHRLRSGVPEDYPAPVVGQRIAEVQRERARLIDQPSVRAALDARLAEAAETARNELTLVRTLDPYLSEEELRRTAMLRPYAQQIAANLDAAQMAAIDVRDLSVGGPAGAPSADDIARTLKDQFDAINARIANETAGCRTQQHSQFEAVGALRCAQLLTVDASGGLNARLLHVTKIACSETGVLAGYICDFSYGLATSNAFLQGYLGDVLGGGDTIRGQFIPTQIGWMYQRFP
ncbi:MAG: hypothetical protein ACE360_07360 [Hyphomicrobiales bacterium]